MRPKKNRALALLLSAAMLSGSVSGAVMGEELPGETTAAQETQAESTAAETQPESQQAEETQAEETQAPTEAQTTIETEAPTETQTTAATEKLSEKVTEDPTAPAEETETGSETETETEEETDTEEETESEEETEDVETEEETEDVLHLQADYSGETFTLKITTLYDGDEADKAFVIPGLTYEVLDPQGNLAETIKVTEDEEIVSRGIRLDEASAASWKAKVESVEKPEDLPAKLESNGWTVKLDTAQEENHKILEAYDIVDLAEPQTVAERTFDVVYTLKDADTQVYDKGEDKEVQYKVKPHDTLTVKAVKAGDDAKTAAFLKDAKIILGYRIPDTETLNVLAEKGIETPKEGEEEAKAVLFSFDKEGTDKETLSPEKVAEKMGIAQDKLSELNGKELVLRLDAPEGYRKIADEIVVLSYRGGKLSVNRKSSEEEPIVLEAVSTTAALNIVSLLNDSKKEEKIAGVTYRIQYSLNNGKTFTDLKVQHVKTGAAEEEDQDADAQFISEEDKDLNVQIVLWDEILEALDKADAGKFIPMKVIAESAPGYKLSGKSSKEISLFLRRDEAGNAVLATAQTGTDATAVFTFDELPGGDKSITVVKRVNVGDEAVYFSSSKVYYVALFDAKGVRISKPQKLDMSPDSKTKAVRTYASTTFKKLAPGTYYVREVEAGNANQVVPTKKTKDKDFYAVYASNSTAVTDGYKVKLKASIKTTPIVTITNKYAAAPKKAKIQRYGTFYLRFTWNNKADRSVKRPEKLYYKVYIKGASGNYNAVTSKGKDAVYAVTFTGSETTKTIARNVNFSGEDQTKSLRIVQVNADGSALAKDEKNEKLRIFEKVPYEITYTNQDITVNAKQNGNIPMVQITDKVVKAEEETEDDSQLTGALTLTKKVTYKNEPIRVNAVYYIGIFNDAGLKDLRMKKAMRFKNASEVSATLKINLFKLKSKEVSFYIAEVDKDGKAVGDGAKYGYEISQNKTKVTLNKDNKEDTVVITNNIKKGSRVESALTSTGSGFAGDSAALAQAQQLESEKNDTARSNTGDSTPLLPLTAAIVLSVIALILLGTWLLMRRKSVRRR